MHFLECYALNCGLKIDKPFIKEQECEVPDGDYITFHGAKDFQSKSYDYWQEVVDTIKATYPDLKVVQIGAAKDNPLYENTIDYNQIASSGNSIDFGDLSEDLGFLNNGVCSNGHGGLG